MNKESDLENTFINDRYATGMHAVPPLIIGNYMPSGPDVEIDYSKFTYGSKQTSVDESNSKPSEHASCESDSSVETTTCMPTPVKNAPKVVYEPKVWIDASIIEDYESDSDNDLVSNVQEDKETPSFAFTDSVKHVKTFWENVKESGIPNHSPKVEKQGRNGHTRKGLEWQNKLNKPKAGISDPHKALKDKGIVDSGCSRHMTGNKAYLIDYQEFKGGSVVFGGSNGRITGKEKIKDGKLDFKDVYYVEELKQYNLFSVSQMYDKKNKVLFTDIDCLVLSPDFKLPDKNQVLLKIPRQHNLYSFNLKNIDPSGDLACLFAKASIDESNKWHRRLGHVNFKNLNKLVKQNLVRGLPSKIFENDHTCVACQKGKKHKASCKAKTAKAVNTACYVLNRVLVTKPQNKTPYEFLTGKQPIISYLRPFGCHVTILNTIDQLGKFDRKSDSGFLVGYSLNSKDFRVYNLETKRVEENLHVNFLENKPNFTGKGHAWMFDLDYLTNSMNYEPISGENQGNKSAGPKEANNSACTQANQELEKLKRQEKEANDVAESPRKEATHDIQNANTCSTNLLNIVSTPLSAAGPLKAFNDGELSYPDDHLMPHLEDIYASPSEWIFTDSSYDDEGVKMKVGLMLCKRNCCSSKFKRQEEGIDYDEVFALVARIEVIRIFLAFASYIGFIVYQMDVNSAFLYGTVDEEVYVTQPPGFVDPKFPNKVYKVMKALYGLHQAPIAWYATLSTFLEQSGYRKGAIDKTLFIKQDKKDIMLVKQKEDGIFISQDKYVAEILKKFDFLSVKTASTPIETHKPLVKDEEDADVDVTPKTLHLQVMKRIFRYLKGQPKLGLWYPKVSSFDLKAYSDTYYASVNLDRKSTTGGCQFLGRRLIPWQCKK
nr:hypothetical protein [Tanacetum cinerariifolium]